MSGIEMDLINMNLPDIPRHYTALAEWLACLLCIMEVKQRIRGWRLWSVSAAVLVVQTFFMMITKGLDNALWLTCMAAAVGVMYGYIYGCADIGARNAGYCCARAFVVAEFAASLQWQTYCWFYFNLGWTGWFFRGFWLLAVYGVVYLIVWALYYNAGSSVKESLDVTNRELAGYIIIGLAVFLMSNMGFVSANTIFGGVRPLEIFNVRTLVDLGGVAIMYAYHMQRVDLRRRTELSSMENILQNQYIQYQQSREAMELINYKYHDLKHHIIALRAEDNDEKRKAYLDQMEEELQNYEAAQKTGNQVLDTLLTTKTLFCKKNHISMTCVVDGSLLDFMDVMDICSIFGNALDNAIECEKQIGDQEKRLIHVNMFRQKNFLIIRFENYCEEPVLFERGLPVTTKEEAEFHGYGLKSLWRTVHKYKGEVQIDVEDGWFSLKILIPL